MRTKELDFKNISFNDVGNPKRTVERKKKKNSTEEKGCRKGPKGTNELLYRIQNILRELKAKKIYFAYYHITTIDATISNNIQNPPDYYKLCLKIYRKLESGIKCRDKT